MTTAPLPFRVSVGLKDLIGRHLITDDFVAVFELVKNSFDAHATDVNLTFEDDGITIADNGKGMSREAILEKWMVVAYSAKRDGTEDDDYRHALSARKQPFAGDKGIGRFSCDRLGERLTLSSRSEAHSVQIVTVDWTRYEKAPRDDFDSVAVEITEAADFPDASPPADGATGTVLRITGLRATWDRDRLLRLRRGLEKLINPFDTTRTAFRIHIDARSERRRDNAHRRRSDKRPDRVNGPVENRLLDVLKNKTTQVRVAISKEHNSVETVLEDRGKVVYRIREPNEHERLRPANVRADIYYLNRSAKTAFKHRMGVGSADFGSIFLFRNGFRLFPIGEKHDDFFGLAWRKQQGVRRFLGTRDIIGRVDVDGIPGFDESTSRDQGLIRTPEVSDLVDFVVRKCVRRLERYVVDVTWADPADKDEADTSRVSRDEGRARVATLVARLSETKDVEIVEYNRHLVRIVDRKSSAFESSLRALSVLAEKTGDAGLLRRAETATAEFRKLRQRAIATQEDAEAAARAATGRYERERARNRFLEAARSLDEDTILNLHHQIMVHATDVQLWVRRMMGRLRKKDTIADSDWVDFLEAVAFENRQILTAARFATKSGYRAGIQESDDDLAGYIADYIETVAGLWAPRGIGVKCRSDGKRFGRPFRPIDVGVVIDNLVSNAAKANARTVLFALDVAGKGSPRLTVSIADDGDGWPMALGEVGDVFEKGLTTTDGSGLGLFHVAQVIEAMGGTIRAQRSPYSKNLKGAHLTIGVGT